MSLSQNNYFCAKVQIHNQTKKLSYMPEITRFYGIIIKIFLTSEHNPPHFHAVYGEFSGLFDIQTLEMFEGDLPPKAQLLIKEWAALYKMDIMNMWETKVSKKLPPLT